MTTSVFLRVVMYQRPIVYLVRSTFKPQLFMQLACQKRNLVLKYRKRRSMHAMGSNGNLQSQTAQTRSLKPGNRQLPQSRPGFRLNVTGKKVGYPMS